MRKLDTVRGQSLGSTENIIQQLIAVTDEFMKLENQELNYKNIVDVFVSLCSAKYAVFNLFSEGGDFFTTVAFSGSSVMLQKVTGLLEFSIIGKQWDSNPEYLDRIKNNSVTEFESLQDIINGSLPQVLTKVIESVFSIGKVYVFTIERNNKILGEFTVFLEKNQELLKKDMVELFTNQVGLLLSRYQSEQALKKERLIMDSMVDSMKDIIVLTDTRGYITFINNRVREMIPGDGGDLVGQSIFEVLSLFGITIEVPIYKDYLKIYECHKIVDIQEKIMNIERGGKQIFIEYSLTSLKNEHLGEIGYLLLMRDKTHKHSEQKRVEYLSKHDQLTTLYNRRYFEEAIYEYDILDNLPISIVMGDVNGLKLFNDSFGHSKGDELLISAANLLKNNIGDDDVLARIGGDEFVMILPKRPLGEAHDLVEKIRGEADRVLINGSSLSISLGVASKVDMSKDIDMVLIESEENMYKCKLLESSSVHSKTVEMVTKSLFEKNEREMLHSRRVSQLCQEVAKIMGYNEEAINRIAIAGLMHDVGKIGIPEIILNKADKLSEEEYKNIQRHSEIGYRILSSVNEFSDISRYVLEHHERIDGKGYPKGLKGEEIHPLSKIISVVDAFDAMTDERTYGSILSIEEAIEELEIHSGEQFDGAVVEAVKSVIFTK